MSTPLVLAAADRVAVLAAQPTIYGPGVEPCVCTAGRHEHGGRALRGQCARTGCKRYSRDPVDRLVEQALAADERGLAADLRIADRAHTKARGKRKHEGTVKVSASDASSCRRAVQYRERPPADLYLSPEDKRAAFVGTLIHDAMMRVRKRLYPWRLFERTVQVAGLGSSQLDSYDPIMAKVDDTKTAGSWKWDLVTDYGPPASEWKQVGIYGLALVHEGFPVRTLQITYLQREKGKDQRFERPFDMAEAERAVTDLTTLATQIELGIEQPRDEPGPGISPLCTSYCPFRDYCWGVPEAEAAGRSPRSWTLLGSSPEDERVAEVLALYREAQQTEAASKKQKEMHRETVGGIKPGEYGGLRLNVTSPEYPDQKAYIARIRRWGETPWEERGAFEDIEVPKTPRPQVRIGPVPKAELDRRAREAKKAEQAAAAAWAQEGDR